MGSRDDPAMLAQDPPLGGDDDPLWVDPQANWPIGERGHVKAIQDQGRMAWQISSGYNRRALVEAAMSRYKRIIGPGLRSSDPAIQKTEAMMGADVLNHMFKLGKPVTERIR